MRCRWSLCCFAAVGLFAAAHPAVAYRPFDGTDADVAKSGELEIEFGPAGYLVEGGDHILVAPVGVLNYGLADNWELVLEGKGESVLDTGRRQTSLTDNQLSVKHVLRPGSLQDRDGPSVAVEIGALMPEIHGDKGAGFSALGVISQRFDWGTVHLNAEAGLSRAHNTFVFTSAILEGPEQWTVRPVAEVFYEREANADRTVSGLVGVIWKVKESLNMDIAVRHGRTSGVKENEIRVGLTVGLDR